MAQLDGAGCRLVTLTGPIDWSEANVSSRWGCVLARAAQLAGIAQPPARRTRG